MNIHINNECPIFWESLSNSDPQLIFHLPIWAKILEEGYGGDPLFCWMDDNNKPVIGILGCILNFGIIRILYASLPYGGLIGDDNYTNEFIAHLEPALKEYGIGQIRIIETRCFDALVNLGYKAAYVSRHIVYLNNQTGDELLRSFNRSVRKNINKSRREGVTIEEVKSRSDINEVYHLYLKTMAHNKAAAKYPIGRFMSIYEHLMPTDNGIILLARYQGKIIGSNSLVCSDHIIHDIQLSYNHDYQHLRPNDALVFASIEWAQMKNISYYDFMGSPNNDLSLERYKEKWNAQKSITATYTKTLSPLSGFAWDIMQSIASNPVGAWLTRSVRNISTTN